MSQSIPTTAPDVEAWIITTLSAAMAPAIIRNQRPPDRLPDGSDNPDAAKAQLIIRADLQNRVTPVSRYCRVTAQARSLRSDGTPDLAGQFDLAARFGRALEAAPRTGLLLDAEVESGPYRVPDADTGVEYHVINVLLEVVTA